MNLVTPCFNSAQFLEQTFRSVVYQPGFDQVDYVVMDGGSSDETVSIIEKYQQHFKYWQSKPDKGQYFAIAEGFSHSNASIMGWINSDDMLCPWTIQLVMKIFEQLPEVEFITSRYPLITNDVGMVYRCDILPGVTQQDFLNGQNLPTSGLPHTNFISQESTFWRRSLWRKAGGDFDPTLRLAADFELWFRFLQHAELYVVNAPYAMFRPHGANLSTLQAQKYLDEALSVLARHHDLSTLDPRILTYRSNMMRLKVAGLSELNQPPELMPLVKVIQYSEIERRFVVTQQ